MLSPIATNSVLDALFHQLSANDAGEEPLDLEEAAKRVEEFFGDMGLHPDSLMQWISIDAHATYAMFFAKGFSKQLALEAMAMQLTQGFEMGIRYMIWRQQELELGHEV